jgi:uncharacterized OsmC-like protein
MTSDQLRELQAPIKARYRSDPASALVTMRATGVLDVPRLACRVEGNRGEVVAGLHPAAGGDGSFACSGDLLLESLVACAGVTLCAVATAMNLPVTGGRVTATGVEDFRGTLAIDKTVPVGLTSISLEFQLDTTAAPEQIEKLIQLTERYCVIFQTLRNPPQISVSATSVG